MRYTLGEGARARLAMAAVILLYIAASAWVVISIIGAYHAVAHLDSQIKNLHDKILGAALAAAFIPFGFIIFWGLKTFSIQFRSIYKFIANDKTVSHNIFTSLNLRAGAPVGGGMRVTEYNYTEPTIARWLTWIDQRKGKSGVLFWIGGAFCAALFLTIAAFAMKTGEGRIDTALRLTGRLSFLFFWPAYTGSAIAVMFGRRFGILARYGREFGLAYASSQLVHFALVVWLIWYSSGPLGERIMPFFTVGIIWTYILAFLSVKRFQNLFNSNFWRGFRNIGLEYIALVFFADFVIGPIEGGVKHPIEYTPFAILLILGSLLRMSAMIRRIGWGTRRQTFRTFPN